MFSKKATKIDKIFTVNLTLCSNRQIGGEDCSNFVTFLENKNFNDVPGSPENVLWNLLEQDLHF